MKTNQMLFIGGGAVAGAVIGHFLIKKGHMWTAGLAVAGAALGYFLNANESSETTSSATAVQSSSNKPKSVYCPPGQISVQVNSNTYGCVKA